MLRLEFFLHIIFYKMNVLCYSLNERYNMTGFKSALSRIVPSKGMTFFDKPLEEAHSMFHTGNGGRNEVPNVFVLFTDGSTRVEFEQAASELKTAGTTVIIVGIGKYVKEDQLQSMASSGYIWRVKSFKNLEEIAGELASVACKGLFLLYLISLGRDRDVYGGLKWV